MEYIISALWIFLELLNFVIYADAFLKRRKSKSYYIGAFAIVWLIMFGYSRLFLTGLVQLIITVILAAGMSWYLYNGSWQYHLLCVLLAFIFGAIVDVLVVFGTCAILQLSYSEIIWKQLLYTVIGTISKLICILIAYIIRRIRKPVGSRTIRKKWLVLTMLFPAVSVLMIVLVSDSYSNRADLSVSAFVFSFILAIANVAILYLISMMEKNMKEENELILLNQQMEIQTKSIIALEKSYRVQRQVTHEFKHQLQTISNLLANGENGVVSDYIAHLQGNQYLRSLTVDSGHPVVDAILNQKYQEAREHSIEMQMQINNLAEITLPINSLVVLLSNLLDNAIEACMRFDGYRIINCSILLNAELYISIRNTSNPPKMIDGMIVSSKGSQHEHGYGLASIQHILSDLNAEYTFGYESGWFQFAAEVPNGISPSTLAVRGS